MSIIVRRMADFKVVVVGDGPEMPKLKQLVKQYKIESHITFIGAVHPLQVNTYCQGAKVFINPAKASGIDNVTIEPFIGGLLIGIGKLQD